MIPELTGHGVGRTIHEHPVIPNYDDPAFDERLFEGLVVAIEPIISRGSGRALKAPDGWTVVTADSAPAVHVEETVVIGRGDPFPSLGSDAFLVTSLSAKTVACPSSACRGSPWSSARGFPLWPTRAPWRRPRRAAPCE